MHFMNSPAHPIFSDQQSVIFDYLIDLERKKAEKLGKKEQFERIYSIYQGTFQNETNDDNNPLLESAAARFLLNIVQLQRVAGEIVTFRYREKLMTGGAEPVPGTAKFLVKNMRDAGVPYKEVLEIFSTIQDHPVLTAHPTNVLDLERIRAHKNGKNDILSINPSMSDDAINSVVNNYLASLDQQPLVKTKQTVKQEVETALYHAKNRWDAIGFIYETVETALQQYYPENYKEGDLKLNLKISSWVGGDKDGNKAINEETTRDTIIAHNTEARAWFKESLNDISSALKIEKPEEDPFLKLVLDIVRHNPKPDGRDINLIDVIPIQDALETMLQDPNYERAWKAIRLFQRQIDCFGATAGKLEYRENSTLLMQALDFLLAKAVPGYQDYQTPEDKEELYTQILMGERPDIYLGYHLKIMLNKLGKKDENDLSDDEKAFQTTFGRFELALLNPEIIENHVIAEATENFQILGAEIIKKAVDQKLNDEGKIATSSSMRLTPLYESPEDMDAMPGRMGDLLDNPAYRDILEAQKQYFGFKDLRQAVKVAMSDTMRRASLIGARIAIHWAIKKTQQVMVTRGVSPKIDIGGSQTDSMRDGARSMGFKVKLYGLASNTLKYTSQGIDLVHFMNGRATGPFCVANLVALGEGLFKKRYKKENSSFDRLNDQINQILYNALPDILKNYKDHFFDNEQTNVLLEKLDYAAITEAGNTSSRAKGRTNKTNVQDVRSISFTETCQGNAFIPGYLAGSVLKEKLDKQIDQILEDPNNQTELAKCLHFVASHHDEKTETFYASALNFMFNRSPLMRDVLDRVGYSVAATDFEIVWQSVFDEPLPTEEGLAALKGQDSPKGQMAWIIEECKAGAALSYAAQSGLSLEEKRTMAIKQRVAEDLYPHFSRYLQTITNTFPMLIRARKEIDQTIKRTDDGPMESKILKKKATELHAIFDAIIFSIPDAAKYLFAWYKYKAEHPEITTACQEKQENANRVLEGAGLTDAPSNWFTKAFGCFGRAA